MSNNQYPFGNTYDNGNEKKITVLTPKKKDLKEGSIRNEYENEKRWGAVMPEIKESDRYNYRDKASSELHGLDEREDYEHSYHNEMRVGSSVTPGREWEELGYEDDERRELHEPVGREAENYINERTTPSREEMNCRTCGSGLDYVQKYDKWWCNQCGRYELFGHQDPGAVERRSEGDQKICSRCGCELDYVRKYDRWWCERCGEYDYKDEERQDHQVPTKREGFPEPVERERGMHDYGEVRSTSPDPPFESFPPPPAKKKDWKNIGKKLGVGIASKELNIMEGEKIIDQKLGRITNIYVTNKRVSIRKDLKIIYQIYDIPLDAINYVRAGFIDTKALMIEHSTNYINSIWGVLGSIPILGWILNSVATILGKGIGTFLGIIIKRPGTWVDVGWSGLQQASNHPNGIPKGGIAQIVRRDLSRCDNIVPEGKDYIIQGDRTLLVKGKNVLRKHTSIGKKGVVYPTRYYSSLRNLSRVIIKKSKFSEKIKGEVYSSWLKIPTRIKGEKSKVNEAMAEIFNPESSAMPYKHVDDYLTLGCNEEIIVDSKLGLLIKIRTIATTKRIIIIEKGLLSHTITQIPYGPIELSVLTSEPYPIARKLSTKIPGGGPIAYTISLILGMGIRRPIFLIFLPDQEANPIKVLINKQDADKLTSYVTHKIGKSDTILNEEEIQISESGSPNPPPLSELESESPPPPPTLSYSDEYPAPVGPYSSSPSPPPPVSSYKDSLRGETH